MIIVKDLHKTFENNHVLRGVNYHVQQGEKIVVIGPSGSGKSTFLRCLNLLEVPTSGEIWFDGVNITDPKTDIDKVREHMGMVFQNFNLFNNLTIMQNITLAPVKLKIMEKEEAGENALKLLERVGLREKADAYPSQLSGGEHLHKIRACPVRRQNFGGRHGPGERNQTEFPRPADDRLVDIWRNDIPAARPGR